MKKLLFGTLITVMSLLVLESAARVAKTVEDDVRMPARDDSEAWRWSIPSPTLGWEKRPGYKGIKGDTERHFDDSGYLAVDSSQIGDTTQKKIVFIGDSNTFGAGTPTDDSFVEVVDRRVPDVAAINLGVPGYTSYQGNLVLEKYLPRLKPDIVVVSFNFNDRRYVLPENRADSPSMFQKVYNSRNASAVASALAPLDASYFFRAVRRVARRGGLIPKPTTAIESLRVDTLQPRVDEENYRRNLTSIVSRTRERSIPLVLLLLKDNPIYTRHLNEGIENLTTSPATAIAHLSFAATHRDQSFADLARLYLARAYRAAGDSKRAEEAVVSKALPGYDGGWPIRRDVEYNDIMRRVAEDHGVVLVDGGAAVDENPNDYVDVCHFNAQAHRRVGELLATRITEILNHDVATGR